MRRTGLVERVYVTGSSFLGFGTTCELRPYPKPGIHFALPDKSVVAINTMTLGVNRALHYLTLTYGEFTLRLPEHLLGCLYACGLDGVCVSLSPRFCLPYYGGAEQFWNAVRPALRDEGEFEWVTPETPLELTTPDGRSLSFKPSAHGARALQCEIRVGYPELGSLTLKATVGDQAEHSYLFRARPYLRNRANQAAAQLAERLGWPHGLGRFAWPAADTEKERQGVLAELVWHRLLDMLAAFAAYCPPSKRFAGFIRSDRCGHSVDVDLLQQLDGMALRPV